MSQASNSFFPPSRFVNFESAIKTLEARLLPRPQPVPSSTSHFSVNPMVVSTTPARSKEKTFSRTLISPMHINSPSPATKESDSLIARQMIRSPLPPPFAPQPLHPRSVVALPSTQSQAPCMTPQSQVLYPMPVTTPLQPPRPVVAPAVTAPALLTQLPPVQQFQPASQIPPYQVTPQPLQQRSMMATSTTTSDVAVSLLPIPARLPLQTPFPNRGPVSASKEQTSRKRKVESSPVSMNTSSTPSRPLLPLMSPIPPSSNPSNPMLNYDMAIPDAHVTAQNSAINFNLQASYSAPAQSASGPLSAQEKAEKEHFMKGLNSVPGVATLALPAAAHGIPFLPVEESQMPQPPSVSQLPPDQVIAMSSVFEESVVYRKSQQSLCHSRDFYASALESKQKLKAHLVFTKFCNETLQESSRIHDSKVKMSERKQQVDLEIKRRMEQLSKISDAHQRVAMQTSIQTLQAESLQCFEALRAVMPTGAGAVVPDLAADDAFIAQFCALGLTNIETLI